MDTQLLRLAVLVLALALPAGFARAQVGTLGYWQSNQTYRNGATLDLDFANDSYWLNGTSYSGIANFITGAGATFTRSGTHNITASGAPFYLDSSQGQVFVSRASSATYFNGSGVLSTAGTNVARTNYTYNGSSWVNAGTLIEPAATNYILQSGQIGTSPWAVDTCNGSSAVTITQNAVTAPDGTTTATQLAGSSGCAGIVQYPDLGVAMSTVTVAGSVWMWAPSAVTARLCLLDGGYGCINAANVNLTTTPTRFSLIAIGSTSNTHAGLAIDTAPVGSTASNTIYTWGAQIEIGSNLTNYIPTGTSTASRSADVYSVPNGGTYFNGAGVMKNAPADTPRLDHDPTASPYPSKGVLIEESRTNLIGSSNAFNTWSTSSGTPSATVSAVAALDGSTNTAYLLTNASSSSSAYFYLPLAPTGASGTTFTFSVFARSPTGTATVSFAGLSQYSSATNSNVGAGSSWARYNVQLVTNTTNGNVYPQMALAANSSVMVWGAQLEQGSFPTSYIPTAAAAVTRGADAMTIGTTAAGANGAWYTAGQGTLLASGIIPYVDSANAHRFADLSDGSIHNIVTLSATNGSDKAAIINADSVVYTQSSLSTVANSLIKGAIAYSSNVYSAFSGTAYNTGAGISIPAMTVLSVGSGLGGGAYFLDGWVNRVTYFQSVQPNASMPDYTR
ncbi:hypothetical protein Q3C01_28015 [Bradyrhizobium sp. UFLA05-109]